MSTLLQRLLWPAFGGTDAVPCLYYYRAEDPTASAASVDDGHRLWIESGRTVSFATYLNAFPASYWTRWTVLDRVLLHLLLEGEAVVSVYRSGPSGAHALVKRLTLAAPGRHDVQVDLRLLGLEDGGWYWFDVSAIGARSTVIHQGGWYAHAWTPDGATAVIGMPTYNRPDDCLDTLRTIADHGDLLGATCLVVVVDQGQDKVAQKVGFDEVARGLGDKLVVLEQPNLGGSGGYARVMLEALGHPECEWILFMDDDIQVEPDCLLRGLAFAKLASQPLIVGGQMLDRRKPSTLYTMGEEIDSRVFMWRKPIDTEYDHDFATDPLPTVPWLHRRVEVSYNSWWTCLIPRALAERVGLPLPLFLKWDDVEYGLRASTVGCSTVSLPGMAVRHEPWWVKDEANSWQAYFTSRNRLVVATLYSTVRWYPAMVAHHFVAVVSHLLRKQYASAALRNLAVNDFLKGPENLLSSLPIARGRAVTSHRSFRAAYLDPMPGARDRSSRVGLFWSLMIRVIISHVWVVVRFMRLRSAYRREFVRLTGRKSWVQTFGLAARE